MTQHRPSWFSSVQLERTKVLLCDADGNLFPSEEPAFVASTEVTNRFMAYYGRTERFSPEQLRLATTGMNFRSTIVTLALNHGIPVEPTLVPDHPSVTTVVDRSQPGDRRLTRTDLEEWVAEEKRVVTAHLGSVLRPDAEVRTPLEALAQRYLLVAVSSSALSRLDACFRATGLEDLFPPEHRFSAEDSLPVPISKPDPAIYQHAGRQLGISVEEAVAIEDAGPGATSAVTAGYSTVGNLRFVPAAERQGREQVLRAAGVVGCISEWNELIELLDVSQ
jgi:beta-phosphoglucomutase-like phosphatase (HAD superfamily)